MEQTRVEGASSGLKTVWNLGLTEMQVLRLTFVSRDLVAWFASCGRYSLEPNWNGFIKRQTLFQGRPYSRMRITNSARIAVP
ncbi:unnamed protein product [Ectocarpus sp. 6 AP-2014]